MPMQFIAKSFCYDVHAFLQGLKCFGASLLVFSKIESWFLLLDKF